MARIIPSIFWQITVALIIFSVSKAGYYQSEYYDDYLRKGYYQIGLYSESGNPLEIIGTATSVLCLGLIFYRFSWRLKSTLLALLPMQTWVMFSSLWSNTILVTATICVKSLLYASALDVATKRLSHRQLTRTIIITVVIILFGSALVCLSDPIFRVSLGPEGWRGLFEHKNGLASFCLFSFMLVSSIARGNMYYAVPALMLNVVMLYLSNGKTDIFLMIFFIATVVFIGYELRMSKLARSTLVKVVISFFSAFVIVWIFVIYLISINLVDFTGRTWLWMWAIKDLGLNFIFGMGGVTSPADPEFINRAARSGFPPVVDSSYVLLLYNNGIVGVLILAYGIKQFLYNCFRIDPSEARFLLSFVFCYVIYAGMESNARFDYSYPTFSMFLALIIAQKIAETRRAANMRGGRLEHNPTG